MTKSVAAKLPPLGSQDENPDPIAQVKFFNPTGSWTWYAIEFDGVDIFFGLVHGFEKEFGTFSLSELQSVRGRFGLGIERDLYWTPCKVSEIH